MGSITDYLIDVDKTICDNIHELSNREDLLSKNILSHLRNFVEQIAVYVTLGPNTTQSRDYPVITKALKQLSCLPKKYRFILEFHELLQISSSHYTLDSDSSIRLMRKYYHYLIKIKDFFEKEYSFALLENIWDYKLIRDSETEQYYRNIAALLEHDDAQEGYFSNERYYVQKIIPFYINKKPYYEITFVNVFNKDNKMSRITAYSTFEIPNNYAVKFKVVPRTMNIYGTLVTISQIIDWQVSIRPCELEHFAKIFDMHMTIRSESEEYKSLMDYLTVTGDNLSKLLTSSGSLFNETISEIYKDTHTAYFKCVLEKCREFYINNNPGVNVILYLLQSLENELIKNQSAESPCQQLSELKLKNGCIPFEKMPYVTSLVGHNPPIWSLLASIPISGHEKELTIRQLKNKCETEVSIFIKKCELSVKGDIESDISYYNKNLYYKHEGRRIVSHKDYLFFLRLCQ